MALEIPDFPTVPSWPDMYSPIDVCTDWFAGWLGCVFLGRILYLNVLPLNLRDASLPPQETSGIGSTEHLSSRDALMTSAS